MPTKSESGDALVDPRAVATELAAASDALNERLAAAEKALGALKFGVYAQITLWEDADGRYTLLAFEKLDTGWRLAIHEGDHRSDGPDDVRALRDCTRDERIAAAARLGDLYDALVATARHDVARVVAASTQVDAFVARVGGRR